MAQQASCSSLFISRYTYDVFLSFRGEDTRFGFTGNLYSALSQRGIFTFIDDAALRKGEEITPSLRKAIQESRMSIVIFSKNYASSTFCLDELVHILECYTKQKMRILPVFYDVDPSHVRHQTGSYEEAFAKHECGRFKDATEKVQKWRLALRQAADLSGSHIKFGGEYEFEFIKKITEDVSSKLNRCLLHIADYPVGLKARMERIQRLIGAEFDNKVTMLGIHGMGGIGKSTLARATYNLIAHQFECSYFLANVREKSIKCGLMHIQETMLSELVGQKNINLGDVYQGIPILQQRLCRKKVLLVLDDVDKKEQLQATAGGLNWFGSGSIILITTRDKNLLDIHGVEKQYKVDEFNSIEALELFRWNAFKNKEVDPDYKEVIRRAIHYAGGLPLALEIIGSNLFSKTLDEWDSALTTYERIPNRNVQKILRVSYDSLDTIEREIFLDIACFFQRCSLRYVTYMLEARGFCPKFGIQVLREKALIKIEKKCFTKTKKDQLYNGFVVMHDLIESMGKEVIREKSNWPRKRSRLWFYEDIVCVLEKNTENDEIEAMMLDMPGDQEVQLNQKVFGKMKNLQMLLITKNAGFRGPKVLPNSLKVLEWCGYPSPSLPSNFRLTNLVILDLSFSYFRWDKPLESSKVLRHLILVGCKNITQIPDISGFPKLTELSVGECTNLIEIHDSVGFLHNLQIFSAEGCTKLKIFPCSIKLTSLEYLILGGCISLVNFPAILAPMHKLKLVDIGRTAIKNLPISIQNLEGLQILSLDRCIMLENHFIEMLPAVFPNLKELYLDHSNLTILPACIEECRSLEVLDLFSCKNLKEIRGFPPSTTRFSAANSVMVTNSLTLNTLLRRAVDSTTQTLYILPSQQIPEWFDQYSRGNSQGFWFRNELPSLTVCTVFGHQDNIKPPFCGDFYFFVRVNDIDLCVFSLPLYYNRFISEDDHMIILNCQNPSQNSLNPDFKKALKTNEWIPGIVLFTMAPKKGSRSWGKIKWTGVYVNRASSKMENVQFTNPDLPNNTNDVGNQLELLVQAPDNKKQQRSEIREQSLNYLSSNSDSDEPESTVDDSNDQDGAFLNYQAMAPSFADTQNAEVQREIGTPMSEVSREFTHQSEDSVKANMKNESAASKSHKVDEVEACLETKKNQFSEAMSLVNELQQKLSWVKKMEEDLGEQLSAINANISAIEANHSSIKANISSIKADIAASQSERNMDCKSRKSNISDEGNTDMNQS